MRFLSCLPSKNLVIHHMILILLVLLLVIGLLFYRLPSSTCVYRERFENPFPPLGMNQNKNVPDGLGCRNVDEALQAEGSRPLLTGIDVPPAGPIVSLNHNDTPLSYILPQKTFEHEPYQIDQVIYPPWGNQEKGSFEQLAEKTGQHRFTIPELLYDGIWKKEDEEWVTSSCEIKGTYGADKLSPLAEKCLFGQTIVDPPECEGLVYPSPPPLTYVYDCPQE